MEHYNKEESSSLRTQTKIPRNFRLKQFLTRIGKLAAQALLIFFFAQVPLIHHFALPAAWFLYTHKRFGKVGAFLFAFIFMLPIFNDWSFLILKIYLSTIELAVELIDPYLARISGAKEEKLNVNATGFYLGFALIFQFVLSFPLIGVFLLPVAQGAASFLYPPVKQYENIKSD